MCYNLDSDAFLVLFLSVILSGCMVQIQKTLEEVFSWWQRAEHPTVSQHLCQVWVGAAAWDCSRCAQLPLSQELLALNLLTVKYDKEAYPVSVYHTERKEARHLFPGNSSKVIAHTLLQPKIASVLCQSVMSLCTSLPWQATRSAYKGGGDH